MQKISLRELCTSIIADPCISFSDLKKYLNSKNKEECFLIASVFANVCPLYKVKTHTGKVKHRNDVDKVSELDAILLDYYTIFIKNVLNNKNDDFSYNIAAYLLDELDHFNFNDRIVAKVIEGTKNLHTKNVCLNVLKNKILNDTLGEITYLILDKCIDFKFNYFILECLLNSSFLEKCVKKRIDEENKFQHKPKAKNEEKTIYKSNLKFFGKKKISKNAIKIEKKRYKKENLNKSALKEDLEDIDYKIYVKCINALQRLYFTLLKDKNGKCLISICLGLRKYFKIIRKEFHEGIMFLLYENIIKNPEVENCFVVNSNIIKTVYVMFADAGIEFKKLMVCFNDMLSYGYFYNIKKNVLEKEISDLLFLMFFKEKQNNVDLIEVLRKLVCLRISYHLTFLDTQIQKLIIFYDVNVWESNFYEFALYQKMLK
ncbi:hypothetical protein EHP00_580 [Ecytonucleospora hepatopenaei]|uniref:Uncharacterized protein n=1 Tax=Ecytonucleospora hepatopenaei TaxID=646526 RepID=A0A1W0E8D5_9MICR|nr:hypothetical protein EHP00_580 [Ecytonucleospora hepatopenaei]